MKWKSVDVRIYRFLPPIRRATCGQNRFALLLNRGPIRHRGCGNAGIAGVPIFIWISRARWMWAYATGRKRSFNRPLTRKVKWRVSQKTGHIPFVRYSGATTLGRLSISSVAQWPGVMAKEQKLVSPHLSR